VRIAAHSVIVRGPFRKPNPVALEGRETAEKGDRSRSKKQKEALEIITRDSMSILVPQSQPELFRGKRTEHGLRDHQAWTKNAGKHQKRRGFLYNYGLR